MTNKVTRNNDIALLERFRSGEKDACDQIALWVRKAIFFKIPDLQPDDIHDIVQLSLTNLWQYVSKPDFQLQQTAHSLVVRITLARCVDYFRQKRYFQELPESIPCAGQSPEEKVICIERLKKLYNAIEKLRPLCKKLIHERFLDEKTYSEIAGANNANISTLRVQLHKCLKVLHSHLKMCDNIHSSNE
ncbi:sigma-70 family RNA polymerase sigma factor [bacterium]|jgi:RNA polymerase sigma factor (sigma-70 family)|nr:sigma-70 family RNA polymerase sigma factor [bacterium]